MFPIECPSAVNSLPPHFEFFSNFQPFFFCCGKLRKEKHVSSVILRILNYFQVFRAPTLALSTKENEEEQR
jgi:hypothetical protein